ncbi:invasion associated locus B family protein [Xanthobacter pseudotagetidis]|uniref:invasion associated locus B family protein n=1 Tax=Xanthobacter pseudotagetidis TaxID=3119911 RepID=UPI003727EA39
MNRFSRRSLGVPFLAGAALAVFAFAAPALAQTAAPAAAAPAVTETRTVHEDWTVRCKKGGAAKPECEAVQTLQTTDLKGVLAHIAVRAEKDGPVRLIVLVPPGVWLPANVVFKVPNVSDITLTYKRCGQHCVASTELTSAQLDALKGSAGKGEFTFENGSRSPIILPVSFKGLGKAMEEALKG